MESGSHIRLVFGKANKAVEEVDRRSIGHTGLNITDFMILEALLHKGPLPINEIGKKILLTSGSMTAATNRLMERGLIERIQDPADGRRFYLHLSKKGLKLISKAYRKHSNSLTEVFSCLDDSERSELVRLLKKVGKYAGQLTSS
ncbi:MAG: MarR family transcriptional regulator [Desulfofustis sp.]|nr:MarR family transcriptional regulator [Desulfofustis sp.]